jgi:hypothetical protein
MDWLFESAETGANELRSSTTIMPVKNITFFILTSSGKNEKIGMVFSAAM